MCSTTLLGLLLLNGGCDKPESEPEIPPPHVRCETARTRSLADEIVLRGVVAAAPDRSASLSAQIPGRLVRVAVREGDEVNKGDLIAEVETEPARDTLQQAQATLAEATAARDAARTEAIHEAVLVERGIAARRSLEAMQAAKMRAEAAVASATAQVHAAKQNLTRTAVRAPMAGAIVHLQRREGELVDGTPARPICDVVDMSALEISAPATPADLVRLQVGQKAKVRFDALDGLELSATVRNIGRAVGANGMGNVWLSLELGDVKPPLGVLATARIAVSEAQDVVTVPAVAVRSAGGEGTEVVLCDENVARIQLVQIGRRDSDWIEITDGLKKGQRVAIDEVTGLENGMEIDVRSKAP